MIVTSKYLKPTQYNQQICFSISGLYDYVKSREASYQHPSEVNIVTNEPEVYYLDAELLLRLFALLEYLNSIKETLPPHIVALLEAPNHAEVKH